MASNIALIALSITLGLMFALIGTMKLTPAISADMHKELVSACPIPIPFFLLPNNK